MQHNDFIVLTSMTASEYRMTLGQLITIIAGLLFADAYRLFMDPFHPPGSSLILRAAEMRSPEQRMVAPCDRGNGTAGDERNRTWDQLGESH